MAMNERVGINIQATLRADTSQAKAAFDEFMRSSALAAQRMQGALGDRDSSSQRAKQLLREQLGDNFSYINQQKEINKLLHEQRQHYRELSDTLYRQERAVKNLGGEEDKEAMKRIRRMRDEKREMAALVHALESEKAVGIATERGIGGKGGVLSNMTLSGALNGGIVGAAVGGMGSMIMRHPVLAGIAATLGGAQFMDRFLSNQSQYSENLDVAFANLGRRTGMGVNLRKVFEPTTGRVSKGFEQLGFAGEDVAAMAEAYGMPGGGAGSLLAQARFARAFGFGENPGMIAGLGRRATQLGMAEPSQQGQFWAMMSAAVEKGLKNGVDASETMRSLLGMTEQVAAHTGVVSKEYLAGLAGIQSSLSGGPSRFFKGERGAAEISNLMQGLQNPQGIAQERFIMNAIMGQFGGRVPTANQLKLSGGEASAYGQMTEIQQLQYVMQNIPALSASNPGLLTGLVGQLGKGAGSGMESMMAQAVFNLSPARLAKSQSAFFDLLKSRGGDEARLSRMNFFELWKESLSTAPMEAHRILSGSAPNAALTEVERLRTFDKLNEESLSSSFSEASRGYRGKIKDFKSVASDYTARLLGGEVSNPFSDMWMKANEWVSKLEEDMTRKDRENELDQELRKLHGGQPHKQSFGGGESVRVEPIQVTGSIELLGADGTSLGQIPATQIGLLIQKAIQDQSGTPRASVPTRQRMLSPRI